MSLERSRVIVTAGFILSAFVILLAACGSNSPEQTSIKVFASPDDAANALIAAAKSGDRTELATIFGPDSKEILSSGDEVQDKNAANAFTQGYGVMHRWRKLTDGAEMLLVGADNYAFPIPLKKNAAGQWYFDTAAGKEEVLNRRVGRNELAVMDICNAAADAQAEYFSQLHDGATKHQYAQKFLSDASKHNGLYWASAEGQPQSPLGPLVAFATGEGYSAKPDSHKPFHGYYLRLLKGQSANAPGGAKEYMVNGEMVNGFAFVAYPAEYGNSGVMTFMIDQDGVLLEKDLGKSTTEQATAMTHFDPGTGWKRAEE